MGRSGSSSSTTCRTWTSSWSASAAAGHQWHRFRGQGSAAIRADRRRRAGAVDAVSLALERNEIVTIQPQSVADGLGAPFAGRWTLAITRRLVHDIVLLDDGTILAGLRFALERLKQVVELAGAALAAVLAGRVLQDGERVAVVLSGGNVEMSRLGDLLAAGTCPERPPSRPRGRGVGRRRCPGGGQVRG